MELEGKQVVMAGEVWSVYKLKTGTDIDSFEPKSAFVALEYNIRIAEEHLKRRNDDIPFDVYSFLEGQISISRMESFLASSVINLAARNVTDITV